MILAGSALPFSAAARCLASHLERLEGIKKALEREVREPANVHGKREALPQKRCYTLNELPQPQVLFT